MMGAAVKYCLYRGIPNVYYKGSHFEYHTRRAKEFKSIQ
jgi:hypothetical protein